MIEIDGIAIPTSRWNGCGNTFLFLDLRGQAGPVVDAAIDRAPALARDSRKVDRRELADGLVLLLDSESADVRTAMWNADGSRGSICGNSLRCIAHCVAQERERDRRPFDLQIASDVGRHVARVEPEGRESWRATVALGHASFAPAALPLDASHASVQGQDPAGPWRIDVDLGGHRTWGLALSVGNPHLVVPVDGLLEDLDVASFGAALERSPVFPDRVNVSFVRVHSPTSIRQRTFERGAGETLACGSGACAAVVALTTLGLLIRGEEIVVGMAGGELGVTWTASGELWLSGPTEHELDRGPQRSASNEG